MAQTEIPPTAPPAAGSPAPGNAPEAPTALGLLSAAQGPNRLTLPVVLAATFVVGLDFFIVNVAIPSIQLDLHAGTASIEWVVAGFGLAIAALMITAGRLGDIHGRRRVFGLGLLLFTLASVACGIAPNAGFLVAARVAQGGAAALMGPQVLAILQTSYSGPRLAKAFSMYGLTMGLGAVFGQLIGGLLIKADVFGLGWRACFLINLPIGLVALLLSPRAIPESKAPGANPHARGRLDLPGVALVIASLTALLLPLIQGREQGWPAWTWISLAGSVALLGIFAWYQRRLGARDAGAPLLDTTLFHERAFTVGLLAQIVFWAGQGSFFLVLALYLQEGRGLSALASGVVFMAIGGGYMVTSTTAHHLARKLGRQVVAVGALVMAVGLAMLAVGAGKTGTHGSPWYLVPGMVVDGLGMGMAIAPLVSTVLARVAPRHVGSASGVLATAQQVGGALGIALIGIVFYHALGDPAKITSSPHAFSLSTLFLMGGEIVLAALIQFLPRGANAE